MNLPDKLSEMSLQDTLEQKASKTQSEEKPNVYIAVVRFRGGCKDYSALKKALREEGWNKIPNLTQAYVKDILGKPIKGETKNLTTLLKNYVVQNEGVKGKAEIALAKLIDPNEIGDAVADVQFLFTNENLMDATDNGV